MDLKNDDLVLSNPVDNTVKPVSKIDRLKVLKTNGSLMKVGSIEECFLGAFCNTFALH